VRTIVGLATWSAPIYGLYWILKQVKASREETASGNGLKTLATLPLGTNRSLHLVRAGEEVVLVGAGEHGVTPIRTYSETEARALGLLEDDITEVLEPATAAPPQARQPARRAAPQDGDPVKVDGSNAVQLLLQIAGISLVPVLLFTVTGFTRILIVLGCGGSTAEWLRLGVERVISIESADLDPPRVVDAIARHALDLR
jgi:flagellar biogenesis protein FliO